MTDPVVIHSTWDSHDLNADPTSGLFLMHQSEDVEWVGTDNTPLLVPGVYARPRRRHRTTITYVGHIIGDPEEPDQRASVAGLIQAFRTLFVPTSHGDLVEQMPDGSTRTLDVRPNGQVNNFELPEYAECIVVFESYESPDWEVTPAGS